jgi:hypothetical protein
MKLHGFRLTLIGPNKWQTFIDGERLRGVKAVEFSASIDHMPTVKITFNAGTVDIDGVAETTSADGDGEFRTFEKVA